MALKRLQYVINASLLPVSKFIEHYKNAILSHRRGRGRLDKLLAARTHRNVSFCAAFRFGVGFINQTKANRMAGKRAIAIERLGKNHHG